MELQPLILACVGFLAIIVTLVVLHEFGHYLAARILGVTPRTFSFGFGPEIFAAVDKAGTRWRFAALPIGGYVKFQGEMHPSAGAANDAEIGDFARLPRWKRSIIVAAGPMVNLLIAGLVFLSLAGMGGYQDIYNKVISVDEGSPAAEAGIMAGDQIIGWDGSSNPHMRTLVRTIRLNPESTQNFTLLRDGSSVEVSLRAASETIEDEFGNSHVLGTTGMRFAPYTRSLSGPQEIFDASVGETFSLFGLQAHSTYQMATGQRSLDDLSGPLRMAKMSGEQLTLGARHYLYFAALVSIAIAFMNLLPIPGLDGGYLALYAFEGMRRADVGAIALRRMAYAGYITIAALTALALTNDVRIFLSP